MQQPIGPARSSATVTRRRPTRALAVLVGLALILLSACEIPPVDGPVTPARPLVGVLAADGTHYPAEKKAGVSVVTIAAGWTNAEPSQGAYSASYAAQLVAKIAAARAAGMEVILDPGIQYAPLWVLALPGGTQFVNQYGDVFTGAEASGNRVANAVTNPAVRSAVGRYLDWLGSQIPAGQLWGVRQGGGPLGELRYPTSSYNGHENSYWAYDASTQAASPVPGWKPGTGTPAQARQFLDFYNGMLNSYARWLNAKLRDDFGTREVLMLPGWGQRPGMSERQVDSLLTREGNQYNEGLMWDDLLDSLPDPANTVAYSTYLDAVSVKDTTELEAPINYLARLAATHHLMLGGENTGTQTMAALQQSFQQANDLHLTIVMWMNEKRLVHAAAGAPTLTSLKNTAVAIFDAA